MIDKLQQSLNDAQNSHGKQRIEEMERRLEQYKNELEESRNIIERQHTIYYNLIMSTHYQEQKSREEPETNLTRIQSARESLDYRLSVGQGRSPYEIPLQKRPGSIKRQSGA